MTTTPPRGDIIDYTTRGPYVCMWASFGMLLGGVVVASATVYVLATSDQEWVNSVRLLPYISRTLGFP